MCRKSIVRNDIMNVKNQLFKIFLWLLLCIELCCFYSYRIFLRYNDTRKCLSVVDKISCEPNTKYARYVKTITILWGPFSHAEYEENKNHTPGKDFPHKLFLIQYTVSVSLLLLLPPQGFGPDGQNPRRHPRGPRVLGRKMSPKQKKGKNVLKNRDFFWQESHGSSHIEH